LDIRTSYDFAELLRGADGDQPFSALAIGIASQEFMPNLAAANRRYRFTFDARFGFDPFVCAHCLLTAPAAERDRYVLHT